LLTARAKTNWAFSLALGLSFVVGLASFAVMRRTRGAVTFVTRTQEVRIGLRALDEELIRAEGGVRGFVLTGDARFLDPLTAAHSTLPARLRGLRRLVGDDPATLTRLDSLEPLIERRLGTLDATRDLRRRGTRDTSAYASLATRGRVLSERIRVLTLTMLAEEQVSLQTQTARAARLATLAEIFVLTASLLGVAVLAAALVAVNLDLRARARAATALREAEERSRVILATATDGIIAVDARGTIEGLNPAAARIFGYPEEELRGAPLTMLIPGPFATEFPAHLTGFTRAGESANGRTVEVTGLRRGGTSFPLEVSFGEVALPDRRLFTGVLRDITERRRLEQNLRDALELQHAIRDAANNSMIVTDADCVIRDWNATAEQWLGYKAAEVVGRLSLAHLHVAEELQRRAEQLSRDLGAPVAPGVEALVAEARRGRRIQHEWTYVRQDGSAFPVLVSVAAFRDASGLVAGFLAIASDLTERRAAEAARHESEARYRSVVEVLGDGLMVQEPSGVISDANASAERILGCPRGTFVGRPAAETPWTTVREDGTALPPEERPGGICLQTGQPVRNAVIGVVRPDGALVWSLVNVAPLGFGPDGKPTAVVSSFSDITRRKGAEQAVRENQARLQDFLDNAHDFILQTTPDGRLQYVNRSWERSLGYQARDVLGRPVFEFLAPECLAECRAIFDRVLAGEAVGDIAATFVAHDGRLVAVSGSSNCRIEHGRPVATRSIFRDVTEIQRTQAALERARDQAQAANRAKSDFLATMSHELRTPLNSVIGFASVLRKNRAGTFGEQDLDFLGRIADNGKHLLGLINDVLDLAKIEAGRMELDVAEVDLDALVRETLSLTGGVVDGDARRVGQVTVAADVPPGVAPIRADATRLRQVLINLTANALKFTARGTVTIRVVADPVTHRAERIDVVDTGIGIPADRQAAVFEAFQQADSSTSREYGGTGLGLSIARSLLHAMGFSLTLTSVVGEGSTFSVVFGGTGAAPVPAPGPAAPAAAAAAPGPATPARPREDAPAESPAAAPPRRAVASVTARPPDRAPVQAELPLFGSQPRPEFADSTVLVIDNDADAALLLQQLIAEHGARVLVALSGGEGLRLARAERPDLITVDLMMPTTTGWDVVRTLQADPDLSDIPVVVVSVLATERGGTVVGAADLLDKPVDRDALLLVLRRHLRGTRR
jgi:two-component system, sensor histidine kinase and response regulator